MTIDSERLWQPDIIDENRFDHRAVCSTMTVVYALATPMHSIEELDAMPRVIAWVFYNGSIEVWRSATTKVMCQFQATLAPPYKGVLIDIALAVQVGDFPYDAQQCVVALSDETQNATNMPVLCNHGYTTIEQFDGQPSSPPGCNAAHGATKVVRTCAQSGKCSRSCATTHRW